MILKGSNQLPSEIPHHNCPVAESKEQLILIQKDERRRIMTIKYRQNHTESMTYEFVNYHCRPAHSCPDD